MLNSAMIALTRSQWTASFTSKGLTPVLFRQVIKQETVVIAFDRSLVQESVKLSQCECGRDMGRLTVSIYSTDVARRPLDDRRAPLSDKVNTR